MATTIVTKNSSTASAVPLAANLVQGELAVNVTDKRLFTEDSGGTVVELGTNPSSINTSSATITGGTINSTSVGATTASTGAFTTLSASSTLGVTGTATFSGALVANGNTTIGNADTDTITQTASYVTGTQLKSAKTATNTLNLAAYDTDGLAYTNLVTLTASTTPTLALTSTGVGTINNMSIGATTASTGAFTTLSASGNVTLGDASTDTLNVGNGGLVKDASGNVGIGTSSPSQKLDVAGNANLSTTSYLTWNGSTSYSIQGVGGASGYIRAVTNGNEAMRIDSSGNLLVGTTSGSNRLLVSDVNDRTSATAQLRVEGNGYSMVSWLDATACYLGQNSVGRALRLYSGASTAGVNLAAGGTSWGTYSDERLKYDIEPITCALEKVANIRCVSYRLKDIDDPFSQKKIGVIAQDLIGKMDEVLDRTKRSDEDPTEYLAVRYSEIVPVLMKAIQEQQALINTQQAALTTLTERITALEAK